MRYGILALIGLFVCTASVVQAQNLVTNPGFETGDFTGWTVTQDPLNTATVQDNSLGQVAHAGMYAASFGAQPPSVDILSQTLATQSGQQYTLAFFAQTPEFNIPGGSNNALSVYFGGSLIAGPVTVPNNAGYEQYSYTVTATSTTAMLQFVLFNEPDYTQLDDVSVTPAAPAVPEPGVVALFVGMSAAGAGFLIRPRKLTANDKR